MCRSCDKPIDDIAEAMFKGCNCGSRVFRQGNFKENPEQVQTQVHQHNKDENEANDEIAILIKEKGVYSVNIKSLAERESGIEPIFVQDATGKINVLLNPDP